MIRVFIGYDRHETVAFHVLAHSIMKRASVPVSITGLILPQLPMWRDRDERQSTDFAFSRFLVPWLCGYKDKAVFMDCDMLCRGDIKELLDLSSGTVSVVKHDYTPSTESKFLDQKQTKYEKKNWSSVMVFDCSKCEVLTPDYVNSAAGLELHQFKWTQDVGSLPPEWNHLVGEYSKNPSAKLVHFTLGTPCFAKYRFCEFANEWFEERDAMLDYEKRNEYSKPERDE